MCFFLNIDSIEEFSGYGGRVMLVLIGIVLIGKKI